jgi:hypothetical protein
LGKSPLAKNTTLFTILGKSPPAVTTSSYIRVILLWH